MPTAKIKINGVMYTVGGISAGERQSIVNEAKEYANQLINGMDEEIADLQQAVQDTDTYIEGAFKDGLISEAEAKAIQTHLKTLATRKSELDREYSDIFGNVFINQTSKDMLTSAKDLYETSYTTLVNEINNAIVDGKVNSAEMSVVDQEFLDYNQSLSLLVSALTTATDQIGKAKADDAYLDSVDYTDGELAPIRTDLVEAWSEIEQTPTKIALAVSKTEIETQLAVIHEEAINQANAYADPIKTATNSVVGELRNKLADLETYVTNSYSDGNITSLESSTTTTYVNALETAKTSFNNDYNGLMVNTYLANILEGDLQFSKTGVDTAHTALISAINSAMVDTNATAEEVNDVATKFQKYEDAITVYDTDVQKCLTSITDNKAVELEEEMVATSDTVLIPISSKVNTMESQIVQQADSISLKVSKTSHDADLLDRLNQAKKYADDLKVLTDETVSALRTDLTTTEEYIDSSFRDGIIYEAEYKKIQAYLNTLNESKTQFDSRYAEIYGNTSLVGTPKTNLSTAKSNYDTKYNELTTEINNAIEDQLADVTESQAVDAAFTAYNNSITLLSSTLEKAIDAIAQAKANTAEGNAKTYTDAIEVGGRNLIADSETMPTLTALIPDNGSVVRNNEASVLPEEVISLVTGATGTSYRLPNIVPENGVYTFSIFMKSSVGDVDVTIDLCGSTSQTVTVTPTLQRLDITGTVSNYSEVYHFVDLTPALNSTVFVWRPQLERGNKRTDWNLAPEDVDTKYTALETRIATAEQLITEDAIVATVTKSTELTLLLDGKAPADNNYATSGDLETAKTDLSKEIDGKIKGIDFSPYITQTSLTQTSTSLTAQFTTSGGVNLLKNSVGWGGSDFWTESGTGTIEVVQNNDLKVVGADSAFQLAGKTLSQDIFVSNGLDSLGNPIKYTFTTIVKKDAAGTAYMKVIGGEVDLITDFVDGTAYNYQKFSITVVPVGNQITVEISGDALSNAIFTSSIVNIGSEALQWQLSTGEVYNTNVRMDQKGIRVSQLNGTKETGFTVMTPDKFAGYYDVNLDGVIDDSEGSPDEVFRMDKDEFVMKKAVIGPIKIVPITSGGNNGIAFIGDI
jgi:hypothetical protein